MPTVLLFRTISGEPAVQYPVICAVLSRLNCCNSFSRYRAIVLEKSRSLLLRHFVWILRIHIVQTSLHERPRLLFALVFPFLRSQSCVLETRPVLPCRNGYFCKLELVRAKSVLVLRYSCNFSAVGCSQVEHKFNSCSAYRSREIRV